VGIGGEPGKTVVPNALRADWLPFRTAREPAAILLLTATALRRDSPREALAPVIGDLLLPVETLAALSGNAP